jgi:hypothetical protein
MRASVEILIEVLIKSDSKFDVVAAANNLQDLMEAEEAVLEAMEKHVSWAGENCGCYFCVPFRHLQTVREELGVK